MPDSEEMTQIGDRQLISEAAINKIYGVTPETGKPTAAAKLAAEEPAFDTDGDTAEIPVQAVRPEGTTYVKEK